MERADEVVGELIDKSYSVGQKHALAARELILSRCGVKRCKKLVLGKYSRIGQRVEKRGFACVGISDDSYLHDAASVARGAHSSAVLFHLVDLRFKRADAALKMSSVGLKLALSGASSTDTAAKTRELSSLTHKSRCGVLELCKLDLKLSLSRNCVERENVEDEHRAVDDSDLISHYIFKVSYLRRGELAVEHHEIRIVDSTQIGKLSRLAAADHSFGVGRFLVLCKSCDTLAARSFEQALKLVHTALERICIFALLCKSDKHRAACFGQFSFCHTNTSLKVVWLILSKNTPRPRRRSRDRREGEAPVS